MAHFVYILQSLKDGRYYIGETANVDERLTFHNAGRQRSTWNRIPFRLVYSESFERGTEASLSPAPDDFVI